jgi:hypothetical protein
MSAWKPVTEVIRRKVLVTNNLSSRDANGQMSHVWRVISVHKHEGPEGPFMAFDDANRRIWGVSHYAEIPMP